ncbi:MAG: tRNA (adenosine(37)-N6)-threonylcarbamoyltransferase complex ATPase subunit type 1 TsaE [Deltaproteobacteria bacterium]|nr:tRNA (adenosine(37)-N6)-threonylcarbamoyltransferase complex ATPase subunit type 1 TsaE [Deltaproteobacteria bacterium]
MTNTQQLTVVARSPSETQMWAERLGRAMGAGDVLALTGGLGSGKTTFCQGLARGLDVGADRAVASPTFALVNIHPGRVTFAHADLYRLKSEAELEELGLDEAMEQGAAAIEWAERFAQVLPSDHLSLLLLADEAGVRTLVFKAHGPRAARLLAALGPSASVV